MTKFEVDVQEATETTPQRVIISVDGKQMFTWDVNTTMEVTQ